ncbi:MAG: stage V sporulation protein AD [Clostridia bacterium]|nr:stage V sporulation protein AD [Clostridia bacterium]
MMQRLQRGTFRFDRKPTVLAFAGVAGRKESEGPLGDRFDKVHEDPMLGQTSWEKAESRLQQEAVGIALDAARLPPASVDVMFSGDLLNQCIASTFGLRSLGIPHMGMYGACSTMVEAMISASVFVECCAADVCAAVTSSHFCSSERQFRTPLGYGGQRSPSAQWTVTGAGAAVIGLGGSIAVNAACVGIIDDLGIKDPCNMGAAMAPAAADTIKRFLTDTGTSPADYDLILTGDLGFVGSDLLRQLLSREGIDLGEKHNDCGMMIFRREEQDVHAGGSGCGCIGSVLCSHIMKLMNEGSLNRVLAIATGALMSTTSSWQGESIPGVAHLIELQKA